MSYRRSFVVSDVNQRSSVFWIADIEGCVEDVRIAADEYHKQNAIRFLREVAKRLDKIADTLDAPSGSTKHV